MSKEKIYKCSYCFHTSTDLDELKAHEEKFHGCFRDVNPRKPKAKSKISKRTAPKDKEVAVFPDGEICVWNGYKYVDLLPNLKFPINEGEPHKVELGDGKTKYKCKNCGRYIKFLLNPYTHWSMPLKKRVRIDKNSLPLILCPFCGFNIFKYNILSTYKWLIAKPNRTLPKAMSYEIMMSAVSDDDRGIIRREKANEIL
jgi:hypothetical protein